MLGLCALHLLARAITKYYVLGRWLAMMCCDDKWALLLSSHHKGRIRPSAKCADIRRSFQATKQTYQGRSRVWTHWPTSIMIVPQYHTTAQLRVQHASKTCSDKGHYQWLPQWASPNSSTRGCCAHSLGRQPAHCVSTRARQLPANTMHASGRKASGHMSNSRK